MEGRKTKTMIIRGRDSEMERGEVFNCVPCCGISSFKTRRSPFFPPTASHPLVECQAKLLNCVSLGTAICVERDETVLGQCKYIPFCSNRRAYFFTQLVEQLQVMNSMTVVTVYSTKTAKSRLLVPFSN